MQRLCAGEEFSIDVFCDLDGRCLNAIPRTMIESKGGESIKGMTIKDPELIEFGRARRRGRSASAARRTSSASASSRRRHEVTDVNPRFGGALPAPARRRRRATRSSRSRSRAASGRSRALGDFREGVLMTRFFSHLSPMDGGDGTLEPFAEELPEPVASEPGDA